MKYFVSIIIFLNVNLLHSQFSICPIIGLDVMKASNGTGGWNYESLKTFYYKDFIFGLRLQYQAKSKWYASIQSDYSAKVLKSRSSNFEPTDRLKFSYLQNSLIGGYNFKKINLGLGYGLNYLANFSHRYKRISEYLSAYYSNTYEHSAVIEISYSLRKFAAIVQLRKGLKYNPIEFNESILGNFNHLVLMLTYEFQPASLFKKQSKLDCPKI